MLRILLLLLLGSGCLWADPIPCEVEQAYLSLTGAWVSLDPERVLEHFTADAHILDGRGMLLDREGLESSVEDALEGSQHCRISYKILSARVDKEGDLLVRTHQERVIDYETRVATRVSEREDSWRESAGGWKINYVVFITQSATVESRAVRPPRK
ncbi:SgcJ/EcaC family oxidoreductase [bacterium]|nr:SgcJ/EcaC family oxidoreductase [bacterium]